MKLLESVAQINNRRNAYVIALKYTFICIECSVVILLPPSDRCQLEGKTEPVAAYNSLRWVTELALHW